LYSTIAEEARRYLLEKPEITGLVEPVAASAKMPKLSAVDKLNLAFSFVNR
jgi:hypothetical protein